MCVPCPITRTQASEDDGASDENSRLRPSGTHDSCAETPSTNNPDSSEDVCQYLDRMVIERFTPDSHKIMFNKVGDEHPDSDVDKDTMSAMVKLAKVLDEHDIGQPASCKQR